MLSRNNMFDRNKFYLGGRFREIKLEEFLAYDENKPWIDAVNHIKETPVHIAAQEGNFQLIKSFLYFYSNINAVDEEENTVLHFLLDIPISKRKEVYREHIDVFRKLLSKGADINKPNRYGWTPIHYAAKHCHLEMLKIAVRNEANFNLKTITGYTPLLLACRIMIETKDFSEIIKTIDFFIECCCDINASDDKGYSALHYAVEKFNVKAVNELLERDADVNVRTEEHKLTPLHFAVKERSLKLVKILSKAGAIVESKELDEITPLQLSVLVSSSDITDFLIKNGADVDYPDKILKLAPLHLAVYQQRRNIFQVLLDRKANINRKGKDGLTPLHISSMLGNVKFTTALINYGADVNFLSNDFYTPLHVATLRSHKVQDSQLIGADVIRNGNENSFIVKMMKYPYDSMCQNYKNVLRLLLRNGANVNALTSNNWSPLHFATKSGRCKLVEILLENGANIKYIESEFGFTALHFASANNFQSIVDILIKAGADANAQTLDGRRPIHLALRQGGISILKKLVKSKAMIDCKEPNSLSTPLHVALSKKREDAAKFLIEHGADVNALTRDGKSPMHWAAEMNCTEILKLLNWRGANPNLKETLTNSTPLHLALRNSSKKAAIFLINMGADVNCLTQDGKSPLHFSLESNCKEIVNDLIMSGAKLNCKRRRCLYSLLFLATQNNCEIMIDILDEKDKTPFISAISKLQDKTIKKAIFQLTAFMDARNKIGCMDINPEVNKCLRKNLECLIEYQVDTQDYNAGNEFISYRVLSGTFEQFNQKYQDFSIPNYRSMLQAAGLPLSVNPQSLNPSYRNCTKDVKRCLDEIKKLTKYSIGNGMTLYNILHMRPKSRRFSTRNLNLMDIHCKFEIYGKLIKAYHYEDKIKTMLLDTFQYAFHKLTDLHLPVTCIDEIFWNLGIMDIIAAIEATDSFDSTYGCLRYE